MLKKILLPAGLLFCLNYIANAQQINADLKKLNKLLKQDAAEPKKISPGAGVLNDIIHHELQPLDILTLGNENEYGQVFSVPHYNMPILIPRTSGNIPTLKPETTQAAIPNPLNNNLKRREITLTVPNNPPN
jgi:hypothetical protein